MRVMGQLPQFQWDNSPVFDSLVKLFSHVLRGAVDDRFFGSAGCVAPGKL
jgi:hypothetical protein